jgi:dolichyl-phosphate-mannose-protein mannosyltransferase
MRQAMIREPMPVRDQGISPARSAWIPGDPAVVVLLLLPLAILAFNSHWIFSAPFRDPWIYYGYFQDAPAYVRSFPTFYYTSRLSVILPGYALHGLLSPIAANLMLHLAVYWTAVFSIYFTARLTVGRRAALPAAIALGGYPFFLSAVGWNYVDGFGIAFVSAAFLLLTLAARYQAWRLLLALAGVAMAALVTANPFYAAYLPFLAVHFIVASRARGSRPLLSSALYTAAGAVGLFLIFCVASRAMGGPFFYLRSALHWSLKLGSEPNPFHHPASTWLPTATWLAVPGAILLGAVAALERLRQLPADPTRRFALAWQLHYLAFAAAMILLQAKASKSVLETYYYASLLIPFVFLALAGQLAWFSKDLSSRAYSVLVGLAILAQLLPPALSWIDRTPELMRFPVLLPFAAGALAAGILWIGARGLRAGIGFLFCLGLSQLLMSNVSPIFRRYDAFDGQGSALFLQLDRAIAAIRQSDPAGRSRLWYDLGEKSGGLYDAVACAFLLCPRMVNLEFPVLHDGNNCDGTPIAPGQRIAILSSRADAVAQATASLRNIGFSGRLLERQEIPGPAVDFTVTFLETVPAERRE